MNSRTYLGAFCAVALLHVVAVAAGWEAVAVPTKFLLMPLLAAWFRAGNGPWLVLAGLGFSWLGDMALEFDGLFIAGMACFAVAHVCYVTFFLKSSTRRGPLVVAAYGLVWLVLIVVLWPGLGDLRIPIAGYSLLLTATAVTSLWFTPRTGVGGALFLISDALIAAGLAGYDLPQAGLLIMVTYLAAQWLIASGSRGHVIAQAQL